VKEVILIYAHDQKPYKKILTDAGFDLRAAEDVVIEPLNYAVISTGVRTIIPEGYYGQIQARSGLAVNNGIITMAGVIDSSYRGEIKVVLFNAGKNPFKVSKGDRIAQIIFIKILLNIKLVEESEVKLKEEFATERNENGFGSSGVN